MIADFHSCIFGATKIGLEFEPYPQKRMTGYCTRAAARQLCDIAGVKLSSADSFVMYGDFTFHIVGDPYEPARVGCIYRDPSSKGTP